jgi:hypothetical protein
MNEDGKHNILPGYKRIEEFPSYQINEKFVVRHVKTREQVTSRRRGKIWVVDLTKNGETFVRGVAKLKRDTFGE